MNKLRVALLQIEPRGQQDRQEHLASVAEQIRGLDAADLIVLPELWNVGYFAFDDYADQAEALTGATVEVLAKLAGEAGAILHAGSLLERDPLTGALHNTSIVFSPQGEQLAVYRKMHVFGYQSRERELVTGGRDLASFPIGDVRAGLAICYDLRFPELFRAHVDQHALQIIPATWPAARVRHWRALIVARAIENQTFVIGCNAAGRNGGVELGGHSVIVDPLGNVVAEATQDPMVLRATIDLDAVAATRGDFPALRDRVLIGDGADTRTNGDSL